MDGSPVEVAAWSAYSPVQALAPSLLERLDPAKLSVDGRLDLLRGLERLKAWADAVQVRTLACLAAEPEPAPEYAGKPSRLLPVRSPVRSRYMVAWADGGTTATANLHAQCPRHHTVKHSPGWRARRTPDGSTEWTTPTGRSRAKAAESYPVDRTLPSAGPDPPD
jgi:hypothetical protein